MIYILVAKTKQQELFYLTGKYARKELLEIRSREQFFCPSCQAPLLLKIGEINIPHFAHKSLSDCDYFSEPESPLHLHGKLLLYHFFQQLDHHVELEKHLSAIRQRADLLVDGRYAIEFQCSTIPATQLNQRSEGYRLLGVNPIWIKGLKQPCREEIGIVHLKSFEIAMRQESGPISFILLFHPPGDRFYYHSNLFYISPNRWAGKTKSIQSTRQVFPFAIPKRLTKEEFRSVMGIFQNVKRRYIRSQLYAENRIKNSFCRLCYELRIDVGNVPDFFGIPMLGAECMKSPAVVWQLQTVAAWEKGISMEVLAASGRVPLTNPGVTGQAASLMTEYLTLYLSFANRDSTDSKVLDSAYDIYCKNLRKLRK
ncbi:competence protein CoiA family protein [uncultured Planococcus sp.]|uniref:competence protein CoiA n=1 Tax=uncultured Planococcus sp. TaxID=337815 RepID=UPI002608A919|nr:competence protein CoiA family protein [uncultured Planococcus sp.]